MPRKIREIRIDGNIAYVLLTQGYEAIIDAEDVHLVAGCNWSAAQKGGTVYAQRTDCSGPKQKTIMLHRIIMGDPIGLDVDHRDGNGLNNRRRGDFGNLRVATPYQNQSNRGAQKNNTSGFKGVTLHRQMGKWQAQIGAGGVKKYLGIFETPEAAHDAYVKASAELHGEFGRTT
jgi:hypothetical protein